MIIVGAEYYLDPGLFRDHFGKIFGTGIRTAGFGLCHAGTQVDYIGLDPRELYRHADIGDYCPARTLTGEESHYI